MSKTRSVGCEQKQLAAHSATTRTCRNVLGSFGWCGSFGPDRKFEAEWVECEVVCDDMVPLVFLGLSVRVRTVVMFAACWLKG